MSKKLNYELYDDRVLVKPAKAEEKTAGGIIIPDTAKEKPQRGTVVAVGIGKYSGTEITVEGEELLIMRSSDILMKTI